MMSDRFELEQKIMQCWAVVDDIDVLYRRSESNMSPDELANFLLGLKTIYQAKFEDLFGVFEQMVSSKQFADVSGNDD